MIKMMTPKEALTKLQRWCAYQERSQNQVRLKLRSMGVDADESEKIIAQLISDNYLNEERFALALAGGKFRIKSWGKNKIERELKKHKVSQYSINKALKSIEEPDYDKSLLKVLEKKLRLSKKNNERETLYWVINHALSKGYELDLIKKQLKQLTKTEVE